MDSPWSLSGWLSRRVAFTATLSVTAALLVGGWFLDQSVSRELRALVNEELDEAATLSQNTARPFEHFDQVAAYLAGQHRLFPMAWRVRASADSTDHRDHGSPTLEHALEWKPTSDGIAVHSEGLVTGSRQIHETLHATLAIDGSLLNSALEWYWITALCLAIGTLAVSMAFGRLLGTQIGKVLSDTALHVQEHAAPPAEVDGKPLPAEIASVARSLSEKLANIRDEAEKSRVFVASLAHELRSPIQNLIAQTEVLMMRPRSTEDYQRVMADQIEELGLLSQVVNNLLAYCTRTRDLTSTQSEEFDLGVEVRLRLKQELARATRCAIELTFSTRGDTRMRGDREALLRAVRNIVANAIDWSPENSTVTITVEALDDFIEVSVTDEGPGIPAGIEDRIFEPFFHRNSTDRRRSGYGLGLAIAKAAVDAHHGSIGVDSPNEHGTRFVIRVPKSPSS